MSLPPSLLLLLTSLLPTITASPMPLEHYILQKRAPSPHNIGLGFAIAISVLLSASIILYLGIQRRRTGPRLTWRAPLPSLRPAPPNEKIPPSDTDTLKSRISSPIQMLSSALPELSPVDAQPRFPELPSPLEHHPKALELSAAELPAFETCQASPRRPPSAASVEGKSFYASRKSSVATACRKSVASVKTSGKSAQERPPKAQSWFDRKSWFCRGAMEVEDEEKKIRGRGPAEGEAVLAVGVPPAVVVVDRGEAHVRLGSMDWSGMEWLTKVYDGRKSGRVSGMRSFFISGDEK